MIFELDASNQALGRLASRIAYILRGKNLATYNPSEMPNTEVVLKNIKEIKFTGAKYHDKKYYHYSGYHGGIKARKLSELWESRPQYVIKQVVYNMLPKNKLRDKIIRNLKFK